jgi:hypothetical protein
VSSHRLPSPNHRAASLCLLCAALALALAGLNAPAARSAQLSPNGALSELTGGGETTPTQTTATTPSTESTSGSKSSTVVIALAAAVVLLLGIAAAIIRDARRMAPAPDGQLAAGGTARDSAARMRRRRAKAKAARRQRKRNR